jgi:hypothetical protein
MLTKPIIITILLTSFFTFLNAQNEEQKKWLEKKAAEKNLIKQKNKSQTSRLKSTVIELDGYEIDHGDDLTTGGTLSPSGTGIMTTHNINAASLINGTNVKIPSLPSFPALNGQGVSILLFDNGRPRVYHEAFGERVFVPRQDLIESNPVNCQTNLLPDTFPYSRRHPSIVSGTLIANTTNDAKGLATAANIIAFDWDYTKSYIAEYALAGINVACVPYGYAAGWAKIDGNWYWFGRYGDSESYLFGFYSSISKEWDNISWNAPYLLIVKSAGNDYNSDNGIMDGGSYQVCKRNTCYNLCDWENEVYNGIPVQDGHKGYDCLSDFAVSKNLLVVGAVDENGNILGNSGRGPTDDMRVKPDLVAKGNNLFSTINTDPQAYDFSENGTSYAVGSVAGGVALLLQEQMKLYDGKVRFLSSTLKGLLIHTATDKGTPGPDYLYGWGIPDIAKCAGLIDANNQTGRHIHEFTFEEDDQAVLFRVKKKEASKDLKVTICWTDAAGTPPPVSLNPTASVLVNDIDLRINRISDNLLFYPWRINPSNPKGSALKNADNSVDNVEQIVISDNSTEEYLVKIFPKIGKLSSKQTVSVIISGNDVAMVVSDLTLNNLSINNYAGYEASNSVSCENTNVTSNGKLQIISGNNILLKTGFKVSSGGYFKASRDVDFYSVFGNAKKFTNTIPWINLDQETPQNSSMLLGEALATNDDFGESTKLIIVYPNPTNGEFTLKLTDAEHTTSIQVFNIQGKTVYQKRGTIKLAENFSIIDYPDGWYLIKVQTTSKTEVLKLLKKSK